MPSDQEIVEVTQYANNRCHVTVNGVVVFGGWEPEAAGVAQTLRGALAAARREGVAKGAEAAIRAAAPYFGGLAKFYDWSAEVRALSHPAPAAAGRDGRE